jgi:hypothetical protein
MVVSIDGVNEKWLQKFCPMDSVEGRKVVLTSALFSHRPSQYIHTTFLHAWLTCPLFHFKTFLWYVHEHPSHYKALIPEDSNLYSHYSNNLKFHTGFRFHLNVAGELCALSFPDSTTLCDLVISYPPPPSPRSVFVPSFSLFSFLQTLRLATATCNWNWREEKRIDQLNGQSVSTKE